VEVSISDWAFLKYPIIRITGGQDLLPHIMAHQSRAGNICYFAEGSVLLDPYDPVSALGQCFAKVREVIDRCAGDKVFNNQEILSEFPSYWTQAMSPYGIVRSEVEQTRLPIFQIEDIDSPLRAIACCDIDIAQRHFATWVKEPTVTELGRCYILNASCPPAACQALPTTIKELMSYLKAWSNTVHQRFISVLDVDPALLDYTRAVFLIQYPEAEIAFSFPLNAEIAKRLCPKNSRGVRPHGNKAYRQYLHGLGGNTPLTRSLFVDLSQNFLHERNLGHPSLANKQILVIGCGAIGGHLANQLAALGAGAGSGKLTLYDPDVLKPDNFGRHLLGMDYLFTPKALGVSKYLSKRFPGSRFENVCEQLTSSKPLKGQDLVIDATGSEAFSISLNSLRIKIGEQAPPILHAWVKGNGECVQALWCDGSGACFCCLRRGDIGEFHTERFPVTSTPAKRAYRACSSYTPYAVTAAVSAATLAAEMIVDWIQGDPSPRWRTNLRENNRAQRIKNQNLAPLGGCPACRR
jgi:hypothetical protein